MKGTLAGREIDMLIVIHGIKVERKLIDYADDERREVRAQHEKREKELRMRDNARW